MKTRQMLLTAGKLGTFLCLLTVILVPAISSGEQESTEGEAKLDQPKHYLVKLLGTRDNWPNEMTETEQAIMAEHFQYLKDLTAKGKVLMAGPVFDPVFGLVVLEVASEDEAREIMKAEPSVRDGVHTYTMHEMKVSLLAGR